METLINIPALTEHLTKAFAAKGYEIELHTDRHVMFGTDIGIDSLKLCWVLPEDKRPPSGAKAVIVLITEKSFPFLTIERCNDELLDSIIQHWEDTLEEAKPKLVVEGSK